MRRIAVGRILGVIIAVIGISASIYCAFESMRANHEFHEWLEARPMNIAIDLSRPGETKTSFRQTCSISHGEAIFCQCNLDDASEKKPEELFKGFAADVVIKDSDGNEIEHAKIDSTTVQQGDGDILLARFAPFQNGDYVATIRIDSGAPAFANKDQLLYARYQLCGLEQMPAFISGLFALGAGMIALVSIACVLPGLFRDGLWRGPPQVNG